MAQQHFVTQSLPLTANATTSAAAQLTAIQALSAAAQAQTGIDISHCEGVTAVLSALNAQTITSGTMRCIVYMPTNANPNGEPDAASFRWMKYAKLDYVLTGGTRDEPIGDSFTLTGIGRIMWLPDAVTFSGGASCQLTHMARRRRG